MPFCWKCGSELKEDDIFCGNCGSIVNDQRTHESQENLSGKKTEITKKSNAGLVIGIIVVSIVLLLAIAYGVIWHLIPHIRYSLAEQEVLNCNYDSAYDTFIALGDYRDSAEKAEDTIYRKGQYLVNREEYLDAAVEFEKIPLYLDSTKKAVECRKQVKYLEGIEKYNAKQYDDAISIFKQLGDYSDSKEWINITNYACATEFLEQGAFVNAVNRFDELGNYKDSKEKGNEARYKYVKTHKNNDDKNTYSYLKKLKSINYSDSGYIYDELYAWRATVVVNNSETNAIDGSPSLSKYDTIYMHIAISGGAPDQSVRIKLSYIWPGENTGYIEWDRSWYDGDTGYGYSWLVSPDYGKSGTFSYQLETVEGSILATGTVYITD